MGLSKTQDFSASQNKKAIFFKALGHPARVAILEIIMQKQSCICNEIVEELPLSQSTVSQHLKELKAAGIIKGEIEGQKICYCINKDVWQTMQTEFTAFLSNPIFESDCC